MRIRLGVTIWLAGVLACLALAGSVIAQEGVDPTAPVLVEAPAGQAAPLATGPDGTLWFAGDKSLGRIGEDGKLSEVSLSEGIGHPAGMVVGQEGDLWVTVGNGVDRITTGGAVTRFSLPGKGEKAGQIAVAPDGALWFTVWAPRYLKERAFGEAFVVRLRPDGTMLRIPLPGPARRRDEPPASIVAGPGGDMWFTDPALSRVGNITPDGALSEFHTRLQPEVLSPRSDGRLWFVGLGGVGTIDSGGHVEELRTGNYFGLTIGSGYGAVAGPDDDLWFIGGATRVMRLTPSGHLDVVRGPGAPAATHIGIGPGGSIWVSTVSDPIKGVLGAPLLRFQPGAPGIELQPGVATVKSGKVQAHISCGGSASGCSGQVDLLLGHKQSASGGYEIPPESAGVVVLGLPPSERRLLAARGYARVSAFASVEGGYEGFSQLVLRSPHPPAARPGRPLVMPLPEGVEVAGIARGPDGALWTGGNVGRFNRVTLGGRVSTVPVPGLSGAPVPFGTDSHNRLWFVEERDGIYSGEEIRPVVGWLDSARKISQLRLRAGPPLEDAAVDPSGGAWIVRSRYPEPGAVERLEPSGKTRRFRVGVEPGSIVADRHGGAWFAESGPRLVHVARSGQMRTIRLPHKGFVSGIAIDRRGSVWFTHWSRRRLPSAIGRLTPKGRVTEFPAGRFGVLDTIVAGPDDNVWFTTDFPRRIGRMTPRGQVKTWRRGAAAAGSVTVGPEGNIWFGASDQNTIAVFSP